MTLSPSATSFTAGEMVPRPCGAEAVIRKRTMGTFDEAVQTSICAGIHGMELQRVNGKARNVFCQCSSHLGPDAAAVSRHGHATRGEESTVARVENETT